MKTVNRKQSHKLVSEQHNIYRKEARKKKRQKKNMWRFTLGKFGFCVNDKIWGWKAKKSIHTNTTQTIWCFYIPIHSFGFMSVERYRYMVHWMKTYIYLAMIYSVSWTIPAKKYDWKFVIINDFQWKFLALPSLSYSWALLQYFAISYKDRFQCYTIHCMIFRNRTIELILKYSFDDENQFNI